MAVPREYSRDVELLLSKRHDNGADFWATLDGRWGKGSPFSTFDSVLHLTELGLSRSDPVLKGAGGQLLQAWCDDGRIRAAPQGAVYPCHTANAARALCRLGHAKSRKLRKTFEHLFETQHSDGGWRCQTVKLGRSEETDASNPGVTLAALDAFRFSEFLNEDRRLDKAVRFLLSHWKTRKPLGPCHFGIGSRFLKIEYPFLRYNVFYYVYVLSFYTAARNRPSFKQALRALEAKVVAGKIVVESPNRALARFDFCRKGEPSERATRRYREILKNVGL